MDLWNFVGDPLGYITGVNREGFGGVKKMLFGDPESIKKAYDDMIAKSGAMGEANKQFLLGQQGKALQRYAPIQQMFNSAYGSQGIKGPQVPQVPQGNINQMFGKR